MSRLFFTERGRALMSHSEEITRWRWAQKRITLPSEAAEAQADIWFLAQTYQGNRRPLAVRVNGQVLGEVAPDASWEPFPVWSRLDVPAGRLREGVNEIEFRCEAPAMNAWMLGIEPGHRDPQSFLSLDRGRAWQNEHMGVPSVLRGEYLVRLRSRSEKLRDPKPPQIVYENPDHPRVRESIELVPAAIRSIGDPWNQLLALRTWVAQSWEHRGVGQVYTPWDPWTILDWAKQNRGQGRDQTIAMCVHFAALFTALASALGHRARCVVITDRLDEANGHFMAEVWDAVRRRWVLHDPNFDVHYADGEPLSALDLAERSHQGRSFEKWVVAGKGFPDGPPRLFDAFCHYFASGRSFLHVGVWSANQYVSHPAAAPPNHGSIGYCETEIVWYSPPGMDLAAMFPYRVDHRTYFDQAP
ncbi:MAG: transglutaminase domain-containing protein [Pirellulales bacterium]|nr:transglutaminase domain-containing protein [Pirellulales bacterium]